MFNCPVEEPSSKMQDSVRNFFFKTIKLYCNFIFSLLRPFWLASLPPWRATTTTRRATTPSSPDTSCPPPRRRDSDSKSSEKGEKHVCSKQNLGQIRFAQHQREEEAQSTSAGTNQPQHLLKSSIEIDLRHLTPTVHGGGLRNQSDSELLFIKQKKKRRTTTIHLYKMIE